MGQETVVFESELPSGFRRATIEGAWLFALALPLACQRTGAAPEPEPPTGAYRHEASATTAPSVHHFMPRFDEIDLVELIGSPDSERHLLDPVDEWSFDREAHALEIGVPVPEGRRVAVWATRAVPWRWNSAQPIVADCVLHAF